MSLWLIQTKSPCMSYIDNGFCTPSPQPRTWKGDHWEGYYNPWLVTCPRHFQQTTSSIGHFYYDPGADMLRAIILYNTTYWPSWDAQRLDFVAETGEWFNREAVLARQVFVGVWGTAWTGKATMGSYNKIYAPMKTSTEIKELNSLTMEAVAGGWSVNPYTWNPKSQYGFAVVNRVDNLLAGVGSWTMDCWSGIDATPVRFGQLRLPNVLDYLAYENRNYCWGITKDGVIVKADYKIPRWEMISTVQNPAADARGYAITFDTRRKRVVVFRWRQDAADGACQNQLEFYYPMVNPARLTQPVPVTSLRAGNRIILVSHLIGDAGEGLSPYTVEGEMAAPVEGQLITPFTNTERSGKAAFQYQAPPDGPVTETLKINTTVEESL
ncbi:MAG: hypothetical protein FJ135_01860 [Deltaproteobacteria bacterium]|nr:hypothetical protein [Deltaproteobacteria bacterium]